MDYEYYMHRIQELAPQTHERLVVYCTSVPLDIRQSYFNNRHPGFNSRTFKYVGDQLDFVNGCDQSVKDVLAELDWLFPTATFHAFEINSLQVDGQILLHTDQTPTTTSKIWRVPFYHSVHIPLTGVGVYESKRGYKEDFDVMHMALGTAYSYNNYVLHQVRNIGNVVRYNAVFHFYDPMWQVKAKMYEHFNLNHKLTRF